MSENMTVCPDCGTPFDTVAQEKEMPLQALQQECPDCSYSVQVAILNYWNSTYSVIAPALDDEQCSCGSDADIRLQTVGEPIEAMCADEVRAHQQAALDFRAKL